MDPGEPTVPPSRFGPLPGRTPYPFRSLRGQVDVNPYVGRIHELKPWVVLAEEAETSREHWRAQCGLGDEAPLHLEIGPGSGHFLTALAARERHAAVVGVEIRFKRVWLTADKARAQGLDHVRVVHHHAGYLDQFVGDGEVSALWVSHPDPWPKERHEKNRILQPSVVALWRSLLAPGGIVTLKTDHPPYGPLALALFADGWDEVGYTADLHASADPFARAYLAENIETSYERKKRAEGCAITVARFARR
jgi:tRNA (guanine-N7-)-methyltransferase